MKTEPRVTYQIGLVGPCGAGKTTLSGLLNALGISARAIAQEHSFVQDMWKRLTNPRILIFLDASYAVTMARKKFSWSEAEYAEQQRRLLHARQNADLYIYTDELTPHEVLNSIVSYRNAHLKS